ncbi:MAG: CHAT domain-containing protein [Prosthecobacter sp.]
MRIKSRLLSLTLTLIAHNAFAQEYRDIEAKWDEALKLIYSHQFEKAMARQAEARNMATKALALHEKKFGPRSPELIRYLKITGMLTIAKSLPEALKFYRRALSIAQEAYGPEHKEVADCLDGIGGPIGSTNEGKQLREQAHQMRRKLFGDDHPETAKSLIWKGSQALVENKTQTATTHLTNALEIFERHLTAKDAPEFKSIIDFFGTRLQDLASNGKGAQAKSYQDRIAKIKSRLSGVAEADDTEMLRVAAQSARARSLPEGLLAHEKLLAAQEKKFGPKSFMLNTTLAVLTEDYFATGDLGKATVALDKFLQLDTPKDNMDGLAILRCLQSGSTFYEFIGDYERAIPLRQRMVDILSNLRQGGRPPDQDEVASALTKLGTDLEKVGEVAKAQRCFQTAVAAPWTTDGQDISIAMKLPQLADLKFHMGLNKEADKVYDRIIGAYLRLGFAKLPDMPSFYHRKAVIAHRLGDLEQARTNFAACRDAMSKVQGADTTIMRIVTSRDEAWLALEDGRHEQAFKMAQEWDQEYHTRLRRVLAFASERQRLLFRQDHDPFSFWASAGQAARVAEAALRCKGIVLDSLMEDSRLARQVLGKGNTTVHEQLKQARAELLAAEFGTTTAAPKTDTAKGTPSSRQALQDKIESLQAQMAMGTAAMPAHRGTNVTVDSIENALSREEVLIEFVRYQHHRGHREFERRYGAVILQKEAAPIWIALGSETNVEKVFKAYNATLQNGADDAALLSASRLLAMELWDPIAASLPATARSVIISPDGLCSLVPFAALTGADDQFLCERFAFRFVGSGRDLLAAPRSTKPRTAAIFANPQFHKAAVFTAAGLGTGSANQATERALLKEMRFTDLPGTEKESLRLSALLESAGWKRDAHTGTAAREKALRQMKSPSVLHIATHGFFVDRALEKGALDLTNPMLRSGIALSSAQDTLTAWSTGKVPDPQDDGLLLAFEAASLELDATWLVTLSACETGVGTVQHGEGVFGLRRSFIQAGAQNVLMTLWPIGDDSTVEFMLDFYRQAITSGDAPGCLNQVQRERLLNSRKDHGLRRAILDYGGFIMTSKGAGR